MSGEKTEEPTDKKLDDEREKGNVAKSQTAAKAFELLIVLEAAFAMLPWIRNETSRLMELPIVRIDRDFRSVLGEMIEQGTPLLIVGCVPIALLAMISVAVGHWMQFGLVFAPKALEIKVEKFNPVQNLIGMFKGKQLATWLTNVLKVVAISVIAVMLIRSYLPDVGRAMLLDPSGLADTAVQMLHQFTRAVLLLFVVLGAVDFGVQFFFFRKEMRMSIEDMKQEYKQAEGDPHAKGHRKHLAMELAMEEPGHGVAQANAVVVNPTHFAIALKFHATEQPVPLVLERGVDAHAARMIQIARERGVPVVRFVWLARSLYAIGKEGRPIPRGMYGPVALLYRFIAEMQSIDDEQWPEIDVPHEQLLELGREGRRAPRPEPTPPPPPGAAEPAQS
jgi:type III secretion protein U